MSAVHLAANFPPEVIILIVFIRSIKMLLAEKRQANMAAGLPLTAENLFHSTNWVMCSRLNVHEIVFSVFILYRFTLFLFLPRETFLASFPGNALDSWKILGKLALWERRERKKATDRRPTEQHWWKIAHIFHRGVEMMKKFNLMFNSNSHPFFISVFPGLCQRWSFVFPFMRLRI